VCDLETVGVTSIFRVMCSDGNLVRMLSTLDLSCEENTRAAVVELTTGRLRKMNS
jgi:hypothetical protein